jgi:hypothetical protein
MADLVLTTFDWVPELPRGYVHDLRVRWALEEAGLPYRGKSVPFGERTAEHFSHQPFGQVPWLTFCCRGLSDTGADPDPRGARVRARRVAPQPCIQLGPVADLDHEGGSGAPSGDTNLSSCFAALRRAGLKFRIPRLASSIPLSRC